MSSAGFSLSLAIDRTSSLRAAAACVVAGMLAVTSLAISGLNPSLITAASLLVAAHVLQLLKAGAAVVGLQLSVGPDRAIRVRPPARGDGQVVTLAGHWLLPGAAVGVRVTAADGHCWRILVFRDRVTADSWRRLLVLVRFPPAPAHGESPPA